MRIKIAFKYCNCIKDTVPTKNHDCPECGDFVLEGGNPQYIKHKKRRNVDSWGKDKTIRYDRVKFDI